MSDRENEIDQFRRMVAPELRPGLDALPSFEWTNEVLAQVRAIDFRQLPAPQLSTGQASVHREERFLPACGGAPGVRVLIYKPPVPAQAPQPAFLHVHGGGYITGAPEINETYNRSFSSEQSCLVVSVDYRLAPETRYPGSLEDCYAALAWIDQHADELNVDRTRIAIEAKARAADMLRRLQFSPATEVKYRCAFSCWTRRCSLPAHGASPYPIPTAAGSYGRLRVIALAGRHYSHRAWKPGRAHRRGAGPHP